MVSVQENPARQDRSEDAGVTAGWSHRLTGASRRLADLALPPRCLACHVLVADDGGLCPTCWAGITWIAPPMCDRLGTPLPYSAEAGALSLEALSDPPRFDRCRAVVVYGDIAARLVRGLKYADRQELAGWMGGWMVRAGADVAEQADVAVPVPLHRRRLWQRRFNQAAMLADAVGQRTGLAVDKRGLARVRGGRPQVGLSRTERARNVRGAFHVPDTRRDWLAGRRVLLVDDVYTTGATIDAATATLLRAGASAVDVLVFARVVRGED